MLINISVRHTDIPESTKQFIEEKAAKLQKYFNNIQSIDVIVDEEKYRQKVEILVKSPLFDIAINEEGEEVTEAFNKAFRVAEKTIRREKERARDDKKNARAIIPE